jgi:hypothetical protein
MAMTKGSGSTLTHESFPILRFRASSQINRHGSRQYAGGGWGI